MEGTIAITALHALRRGELELSPSLGDSSRMVCSDGDPLWAMPLTAALESFPSGGGFKLSERLVMNSGASKWVAYILRELGAKKRWVSPVATVGTIRTIETSRANARCKSPFLVCQLSVFSTPARIERSRSHILVLRWSCELESIL
jgi:hypothetical protein